MAVSKKTSKSSGLPGIRSYDVLYGRRICGFGLRCCVGAIGESAEELVVDRPITDQAAAFRHPRKTLPSLGCLRAERSFDSGLRAFGRGPMHGDERLGRMAQTGRLYVANDFSPPLAGGGCPPGVHCLASGCEWPAAAGIKAIPEAELVLPLAPASVRRFERRHLAVDGPG